MKVKTIELSGTQLDWAVARLAIGYTDEQLDEYCQVHFLPAFSTDWAQGGSIIEREGIALGQTADGWEATCDGAVYVYGKTPLIAAMRCYAINNLGKEVEVPNGL